ncbi:hypothetical protein ACELLULO517_07620 [Acidisoma cellulosilytica]|uniref:Uncharacterized protein n=1 Tax=Acidisoma cellulosilyticum TaxID=2802395 RepID=A0A963YZT9_9PROT|nr:hypothetical protein [Acidisoma cellulosilyticum]MCB8880099.1 hypothetical protein [Acidisoma cellulosilyticum]
MAEASDTPAVVGTRSKTEIDIRGGTVTIEGAVYSMEDIPQHALTWLALAGLRLRLLAVDDRAKALADLESGILPTRSGTTERTPPWHAAMADAVVEESARAKRPLTHEAALEQIKGLSRSQLAKLRQDPQVVHFYRQRTGEKSGVLDILNAASETVAAEGIRSDT